MVRRIFILLSLVSIIFSSCTSRKSLVFLENRSLDPNKVEYTKSNITNTLQPGDVVYVKILSINQDINALFNLDNSSSQGNITSETTISLKGFTINPEGYISLPIIDTIHIKGLTIFDAQKKIQQTVDSYFKNATVIVKLLNSKISVLGEVNRPGNYMINRNDVTIFEAIAMAGDIGQYGDKRKILVIRTSGEKNVTYRVDLTNDKIMNSENLYLLANDIIIVEPVKLKAFRLNQPTVSLVFGAISTLLLTLTYINK